MAQGVQTSHSLVKRIAITGPESTGKSTLAKNLAQHFDVPYVPEFARNYLTQLDRPYSPTDVEFIAQQQVLLEKEISSSSPPILFCDTATLVPKIWFEYKYKRSSKIIDDLWQSQVYDFWLLCNTDIPWVADPLREHPNSRNELFSIYSRQLKSKSTPYAIIKGDSTEERLEHAKRIVSEFLEFKA